MKHRILLVGLSLGISLASCSVPPNRNNSQAERAAAGAHSGGAATSGTSSVAATGVGGGGASGSGASVASGGAVPAGTGAISSVTTGGDSSSVAGGSGGSLVSNSGGEGAGAVSTTGGSVSGVGGVTPAGTGGGSPGTGGGSPGTGGGGPGTGGGGPGTGGEPVGPGTYALPPPSQCHNQNYVPYGEGMEGCRDGDVNSLCEGKCQVINACQENSTMKPNADTTFICPRFMLYSDVMLQAAIDDGNTEFNYAVVGHDVDAQGIDSGTESTCCQCYQLVYAHPSPNNDRQVLADPDNPDPPTSAIPIPPPLVVQSFNTAATPTTFDVYMAAGGFGANNACAPDQQPVSASGLYLYTSYPTDGQPSQGGVKPVSLYSECKTDIQWVTTASLSSDACQSRVSAACNQIESSIPGLTEQAQRSCSQSNDPNSCYHLNWSVYAMKVECPEHLTEVTGCKLLPQGLPQVKKEVTTAAQAAQDPDFWSTTGTSSDMYETTTMEDCCRPSCAAIDWVSGRGLASDPEYNAFYSCDVNGVPITEQAGD